jgi:hypothetical protein
MSTHTLNGSSSESPLQESSSWEAETPFLPDPVTSASTLAATAPRVAFGAYEADSPFTAEYLLEDTTTIRSPQAERFATLLGELYDREFEEVVSDLVHEGAAVLGDRAEHETGDPARDQAAAERALREYFAPLEHESQAMIDRMIEGIGETDLGALGEQERETFLDRFAPEAAPITPAFNNFLGKLFKKAKKALGKVASIAGKVLPHAIILKKLKGLVRPLIERVLRTALNKLPVAIRPIAATLAQKFLGIKLPGAPRKTEPPKPEEPKSGDDSAEPAAADPAEIQTEFDTRLAGYIAGGEEFEQEADAAQLVADQPDGRENALRELDRARDDFARQVVEMSEGEDPQPAVEQFIPAVLAAARVGIRIIGRQRVVDFLAKMVAKLISKYVGQQPAIALSRSLVDTGLRLVSLETSESEERLAAGYTVASTVEDTVNRLIAEAPPGAWENEALLEAYALEAFEKAAAAAFPDSRIREDLRESSEAPAAWITRKGYGAYKKYSRILDVTIRPQTAAAVSTFGGVPLATFFRDQLRIPANQTVTARVHLYESLPGSTLSLISLREKRVPGLGSRLRSGWSQIHPLTPDAAGQLLGEPGLGKKTPARFLANRDLIGVGQRFYYLEIPGTSGRVDAVAAGRRPARVSQASLVFDFPKSELRLFAYFSEVDAQSIAQRLRQADGYRTIPSMLKPLLQSRLTAILSGRPTRRVRVIDEATVPEQALPTAFGYLLRVAGETLVSMLVEWSLGAIQRELSERLDRFKAEFVKATEAEEDGVTLAIIFGQPAFLDRLRAVLVTPGSPLIVPLIFISRTFGEVSISAKAGYHVW